MENENVEQKLLVQEKRITELEQEFERMINIIAEFDTVVKRKKATDFTKRIELEGMKQQFLQSSPHQRNDMFTDWELVFWAGYLLSTTPRREIVDSLGEVAKRVNRIKRLVNHFRQIVRTSGKYTDENVIEEIARNKVKDYLEYVLLGVPEYNDGKGGTKPMVFWVAVSPWAVNSFAGKLASWQRNRDLKKHDTPLEED